MRIRSVVLVLMIVAGCSREPKTLPVHSSTLSWSGNERAIPKLQERLKSEPNNPDLNAALGQAYLQKARETGDPSYYTKSEQLFGRALARNADHVGALIGKASLSMSRHQFAVARDIAKQAAGKSPYSAEARGILADAYVQLREYDNA